MKNLHLVRVGQSEHGTFGVLVYENVPFAVTLERPWKNNQTDISCIPAGSYVCKLVKSPKFGETYEITEVPGRENVLFHKGNRVKDTLGCVLIGEQFAVSGEPVIAESLQGYTEFRSIVGKDKEFRLTIHEPVLK